MTLSCDCSEGDDDERIYPDDDYSTLDAARRRRCISCNELIDIGAIVLKFFRDRDSRSDVEESIHGDEVPLATQHHCERCADIYFSLDALGFCLYLSEDMRDVAKEYAAVYGPKPVTIEKETTCLKK